MIKIKNKESLKEYSEIIKKLNPVLTNDFVEGVQDYIENQIVVYSEEAIKEEKFLKFTADMWADEVKPEGILEDSVYEFSLYQYEQSLIDVQLVLGVNEEETEVMVSDIKVKVYQ